VTPLHLRILGALPVALAGTLIPLGLLLAVFWVPDDADQGFSQRIFYLHVPVALVSYLFLGLGAWFAVRYLRFRDPVDDLRSYVAIHQGVIFGSYVLLTGPIWAKVSWGQWWDWGDRQLNVFLILFLFYSAYFMLRFSVDAGPRRATLSAGYALLGVGLVPLSFLAVRVAETVIHPTPLIRADGPQIESSMLITFALMLAGAAALGVALFSVELRGKLLDERVRALRRRLRGEAVL
jgi:heme exporter protein C